MGDVLNDLKGKIEAQNAKIEETNTAVAGVAGDVKSLKEKIDAGLEGELNAEEVAELSGLVDGVTSKLDALASATKALDEETPSEATPAPEETV